MQAELDPTGANPHEPGAKLDGGKTAVYQGFIAYFPHALQCIAAVSQKGAEKYTWNGWRDVPDAENRYLDAMMRHLMAYTGGEFYDSGPGGTNLPHLAQVAWNALAVLELAIQDMPANAPRVDTLSDEEFAKLCHEAPDPLFYRSAEYFCTGEELDTLER